MAGEQEGKQKVGEGEKGGGRVGGGRRRQEKKATTASLTSFPDLAFVSACVREV